MNSVSCLLGEAEKVWNPFVSLPVHLFRGDTCALWSHGECLARGGGRGGDRKAPGSGHGSAVGQWVHDRGAVGSGPLQPGRGGPQAQVTAGCERLTRVFAFHLPIKWPWVAVFLRHVSLTILFHPRNLKTTGVRSCAYTCVHAVKARVQCQWFFLRHSLPRILRQGSRFYLDLTYSARLAGHWAPFIPACPELKRQACTLFLAFYRCWGVGLSASRLHGQRAPCYLPTPRNFYTEIYKIGPNKTFTNENKLILKWSFGL